MLNIHFQVGRIVGGAVCDRSWGPRPLSLIILTTAASVLPALALPFCLEYWTFVLSFGLVGFFAGRIFLFLYFLMFSKLTLLFLLVQFFSYGRYRYIIVHEHYVGVIRVCAGC